jgi:hypothetical protein
MNVLLLYTQPTRMYDYSVKKKRMYDCYTCHPYFKVKILVVVYN